MERHACCAAAAEGFALPSAEDHYPPDLSLVPVHIALGVRVDIPARTLDVTMRTRVEARVAGARSLRLNAVGFEALEVELAGGGRHSYDGEVITLTFDAPFAEGEARELRLRYRVVDPITGVLFSAPDATRPDAPTSAASDHETERARYWFACVDHPSVRPTLAIELTADARLAALANGAEQGRVDHGDGWATTSFAQKQGCPSYLTCFAVGDFVRWDGGSHEGVAIAAFAPRPFTEEQLGKTFGRTKKMLEFCTSRLGVAFPFAKYFQFAVEGIGGAMENISLVSWDDRFVLDAVLEQEERHLIDIVNVHEMAHSWFGDSVVCRDFAHSWLKEGWATYMETCWLEHAEGGDAMSFDLACHRDGYFEEVDSRYRRAIVTRRYTSSFELFDHHLYPGAGLRIHMLRRSLGDEVFWGAVRTYLQRFAGQMVETDDFRKVLEERSGKSLARFFDQWFHRPGFPDLDVSFRYDAEALEGVFEITQKQADEKTGEGLFHFELELAFGAPGAMETRRVELSSRRTVAAFAMASEPSVLRVDPGERTLQRVSFDPGLPRLIAQLDAEDAAGRIEAGATLARLGTRRGVEAIRDRFASERYWGVRVKWAEALGKARSEHALEALLTLAARHREPESLAALLRALGRYRDPRVVAVLCQRLDEGMPYRATEAAYEALGAQREAAPLERLLAAAKRPGHGGFAQSGAIRALGASRDSAVLEPLLAMLPRGVTPDRVRPAIVEALGALASVADKRARERAVEALTDTLRDEVPRVRLSAASALGTARAREATAALEALARRLPRQEEVRVRRVLQGLADAKPDAAQARLDELELELRKLRAKVEDLEAKASVRGPGGT